MSFLYACVVFVTLLGVCWLFYSKRLPFTNKSKSKPKIKFINLVLYSTGEEYDEMYRMTKKYYSSFPNVTTLYYLFDPEIKKDYVLKDDVLRIKGTESYIPGILAKTMKALAYTEKNYDFDYVVRSNISTIVDFDLLSDYMQETPIEYGGGLRNEYKDEGETYSDLNGLIYVSGTAIIFSRKTLRDVLRKQKHLRMDLIDDVALGLLMRDELPETPQHYTPPDKFLFVPDEGGNASRLKPLIEGKDIIFYRNRQEDRKTDVRQMQVIIDYLSA